VSASGPHTSELIQIAEVACWKTNIILWHIMTYCGNAEKSENQQLGIPILVDYLGQWPAV